MKINILFSLNLLSNHPVRNKNFYQFFYFFIFHFLKLNLDQGSDFIDILNEEIEPKLGQISDGFKKKKKREDIDHIKTIIENPTRRKFSFSKHFKPSSPC